MAAQKLSRLELKIMGELWKHGARAIREIHEAFPKRSRPAYTTVQTMVYRLEAKEALRRVKKIGNAHIFEAVISREAVQHRVLDELLGLLEGGVQPVMARLVETGKITLEDIREAEKTLLALSAKSRKG